MQFWETINKRKSSLDDGRKKHCMIPVFRGILILDGQESQRFPHDDGETERPKKTVKCVTGKTRRLGKTGGILSEPAYIGKTACAVAHRRFGYTLKRFR